MRTELAWRHPPVQGPAVTPACWWCGCSSAQWGPGSLALGTNARVYLKFCVYICNSVVEWLRGGWAAWVSCFVWVQSCVHVQARFNAMCGVLGCKEGPPARLNEPGL